MKIYSLLFLAISTGEVALSVAILSSIFGGFLADSVPGFDWSELFKAGGSVGICIFVLVRLEPRLRGVEAAIDRLTRMICVMLGEMPHVIEAVKLQCRETEADLRQAAIARGEKPSP